MKITRTADYAIRAIIHLAWEGQGRKVTSKEIAAAQNIPPIYISKVMQALSRAGIIVTTPGRNGGAVLQRPAEEVSLLDVIQAVDGPMQLNRCAYARNECPNEAYCPVHDFWVETQAMLEDRLGQARISQFQTSPQDQDQTGKE